MLEEAGRHTKVEKSNLLLFSNLSSENFGLEEHFHTTIVVYGTEDFEKLDSTHYKISTHEEDFEKLQLSLHENKFLPQIIVHILPKNSETPLQDNFYTMFFIRKYFTPITNPVSVFAIHLEDFHAKKETNILINSQQCQLYSQTVIGPMNEILNTSPNSKCFYVKIDDELRNLDKIIVKLLTKIKKRLPYVQNFWLKNSVLFERGFQKTENRTKEMKSNHCNQERKICIIFGGLSIVGQAYMKALAIEFANIRFILASRTAEEKIEKIAKRIDAKNSLTYEAYNVNLSNYLEVENVFKKFAPINFVVNAAGLPPSSSLIKSLKDIEKIFDAKIYGSLNILKAIETLGMKIDKLFLVSSLTGILGLTGTEEYAAANLFLDVLAESGNVTEILSLQWPAWKESRMVREGKFSKELKEILKHSISFKQGCEIIHQTLNFAGSFAIANANPLKIADHMKSITPYNPTEPIRIADSLICNQKECLRNLWSEFLRVPSIKNSDNFFQLGGHSLNGIQLVWKICETFNVNLTINTLFAYPIFEDFYQELLKFDINHRAYTKIEKILSMDKIPLSYSQENMFLLRQIEDGTHYNIMLEIQLVGENFCPKAAKSALLRLVEKQDSLRTRFFEDAQGNPYQEVLPLTESLYKLDFEPTTADEAKTLIEIEKNHKFSLDEPPFKIITYRIDKKFHIVISHHHIITDGWSMTVFAKEFAVLYKSFMEDGHDSTPKNSISYTEFAVWNRKSFKEEKLEHRIKICEKLDGFGTLLPNDFRRPLIKGYKSAQVEFVIPIGLVRHMKSRVKNWQVTEYVLLLAGFAKVLNRWRKDLDAETLVFGSPVSGRNHPQLDNIIGYFLNNIIIQISTASFLEDSTIKYITSVKKAVEDALEFQDVPFHLLVSRLQKSRVPNMHPLFQIYFNYRHTLDFPKVDIPGVEASVNQLTTNRIFDLSCTIDEMEKGQLRILFDYDPDIFMEKTVNSFGMDYLQELKKIMTENTRALPLASPIKIFEFPFEPVQEILKNQSKITPTHPAIGNQIETITYDKLENTISHMRFVISLWYFSQNGELLGPDDVMPIIVEKNTALLWIFGVLATGACYTPIDPKFPTHRIKAILNQLNICYAISEIEIDGIQMLNPLKMTISKKIPNSSPLFNRLLSNNLAYILFTSGSTGTPKGVCVEHENLQSFLAPTTQQLYCHPNLVVSHSVNIVFDVSLMNMFIPMINGGRILFNHGIDNLLEKEVRDCTHLFLTSANFNCFGEKQLKKLKGLEMLMVGGETPSCENIRICMENRMKLLHIYGPTETTIWSMTNLCKKRDKDSDVLQSIMPNEEIHIVSSNETVPNSNSMFATGELCISGFGVARGYLNSNSHVATSKFIQNQYLTREDKVLGRNTKIFKTGDLFKRKLKDNFHFISRIDMQLKINGIRIDPSEISSAIKKLDLSIYNVVVVTKMLGNRKVLVAFLVSNQKIDEKRMRENLLKIIPSYQIPSTFICIEELPINLSGKVDMQKLEKIYEIFIKTESFDEKDESINEFEEKLLKIWKELGIFSAVSKHSDFFLSGGNSLAIFQLGQRLFDVFGLEFSIEQLYQHTVLQDQAIMIQKRLDMGKNNDIKIIVPIRENTNAVLNVYLIHAIGGTIYPYYTFLHAIPERFNIFAIAYDEKYPAKNLVDLATFYADQKKPLALMGHSLGGILAREMAIVFNDNRKILVSNVVMFDSWALGNENLDLKAVGEYIKNQFKHMPDSLNHINSAIELAKMLKNHKFSYDSTVDVVLMKASALTNSPIRNAIKPNLTFELMRFYEDNGWGQFCKTADIYLVPGDHDSMLKLKNLICFSSHLVDLLEKKL